MNEIRIVDNFLADPVSYREAALRREFKSFVFPGCTFHGIALADLHSFTPEEIAILYPRVRPTLSFFRKSPAGQEEPHFIHTDIDMGEWSAILYLNPEPPEGDGTTFWMHRETGAIASPIPHEFSREGMTVEGWEPRLAVPARFNRLLMFSASFFHSRSIFRNWGQGDEARLTQVTFGCGELG
jgi:hypothetical protein